MSTKTIRRNIRKRPGARPYEARIEEGWQPGPDGLLHRRQRSRSFKTLREAERWVRDQLNDLQDGNYIEPSREKVADYLGTWLTAVRPNIKPSAWASFECHVRVHLTPQIGHLQLQQLGPSDIDLMTARLLEGTCPGQDGRRPLSPTTVRSVLTTLHTSMNYAVRKRRLERNPAVAADRPRRASSELKVWRGEELGRFLSAIADDELAPVFTLLATTGLRRGEALGLRWSDLDLDLDAARLAVRQTLLVVNNEVQVGEPKTIRSRRVVDLDDATVAMLRTHRKAQMERRLSSGLGSAGASGFVFTDPAGEPYHPNKVTKAFSKLQIEHGMEPIRLHDLRHSYATLALQAGIHVKVVSERLGHSSVTITLDTYSHAIPGLQKDAADKVAALIPGLGSR